MPAALFLSQTTRKRLRQRLARVRQPAWLGSLRRTRPVSDSWGYDRGTPIDRYYIEAFIRGHRQDIRGHVLEIKDALYSARYGSSVTRCDILDRNATNPRATVVADLTAMSPVADDTMDCCIVTQTLQYIYEAGAAVRELHRVLRPGGVLLATVPALARLDPESIYGEYWRFTAAACERMFGDAFGREQVQVTARGNVLASIAFLEGLAVEDLSPAELDDDDRLFPVLVSVRSVKRG